MYRRQLGMCLVSIPSRGSGKGDISLVAIVCMLANLFQSPLGEVVKETASNSLVFYHTTLCVSIPSRGSGKGDHYGCHR